MRMTNLMNRIELRRVLVRAAYKSNRHIDEALVDELIEQCMPLQELYAGSLRQLKEEFETENKQYREAFETEIKGLQEAFKTEVKRLQEAFDIEVAPLKKDEIQKSRQQTEGQGGG